MSLWLKDYRFLAMFFFIFPIFFFQLVSGSDPLYTWCPPEFQNYTLNSTFHNNLELLLESLSSSISVSGFYKTSIGYDPDKVYGLALCRGDINLNSKICKDCVEKASQDILKLCRSQDAMIWYELCHVGYSFQMLTSRKAYAEKYLDENNQAKNVSDPDRFRIFLMYLMNKLSNEAAFFPSKNKFASGEVEFSQEITIYGLIQCTRDISEISCHECLSSALQELEACCSDRQGGIVLSQICNVRFDLYQFFNTSSQYLPSKGGKGKTWMLVVIIFSSVFILAVLIGFCIAYLLKKQGKDKDNKKGEKIQLQQLVSPLSTTNTHDGESISSEELLFMSFGTIKVATDDFSDSNKLGQGGFGAVYKGILNDGQEVAIKRLSTGSEQGSDEFTNEVLLILKLQHKNLVRLLGFCLDGEEMLLVYEFLPNGSLDAVLFDPRRRAQLSWIKRVDIIGGIARGILYLHEDSRLKIIHRDLKASNILLDYDMNPKISDFGMARIFSGAEGEANTATIVGTYGYMAPEYVMEGLYSIKSDVFSFGMLLLEIITGRRNTGFSHSKHAHNLLAYAWHLWNEGNTVELMDPLVADSCPEDQFLKYMHVGLLCVQEEAYERPTMSSVVLMLKSQSPTLGQPQGPPFCEGRITGSDHNEAENEQCSVNNLTVSDILPQ
ncbi:cysteine-rich receptor-like protein kinase 10 [Prosopis cineraria]|uniref:cysteine-rich receptor-like protein kinase 10 n=1 Tax=Prosopis cineraria TaxID=364024 RepID=UPI00240FDF75|nr:cysteine-rich receptor-like protein kinase 10 [Prosopis cineraria]